MYVTDFTSITTSSRNQQTYQRLRQGLSLGLRRQIFLAICDNLVLRDRLYQQLEDELNLSTLAYPLLVSLDFNPEQPNFLSSIARWLKQNQLTNQDNLTFQILGIEQLTKEPAVVQRRFIRCLQGIESYFPELEVNLLLWLPYPWYHTIKESVPEFWRWHTGLFEFWGEPTPVSAVATPLPERSPDFDQQSFGYLPRNFQQQFRDFQAQDFVDELAELEELEEDDLLLAQELTFPTEFLESEANLDIVEDVKQEDLVTETEQISAETFITIGHQYRDRIAAGDNSPENLILAIQAYQQGLQILAENSPIFPEILNDLGNLYWLLGRHSHTPQDILPKLDLAVQSYHLGLIKITDQTTPALYSMIQNNLGAVYSDIAKYRDPAENLALSIRAYQDALQGRNLEQDPLKYASTQNNLGTAYWHLAQHDDPVTNLKGAIQAYQESLNQYSPQEHSMNWAMIQNNLGTAYWNLSKYEQPKLYLEQAINCYQNALKYRTLENNPAAFAATQNNLGTAYWHLGELLVNDPYLRLECLQNSIIAYENAIIIAQKLTNSNPPIAVNFDFKVTLNNLGLVHYQLATEALLPLEKEAKLDYLDQSLKAHLQSLDLIDPEDSEYRTTFRYIINTVRSFYQQGGVAGQNRAFSQLPGHLLPQILPKL